MMKYILSYFIAVLFFFPPPTKAKELSCRDVHYIQKRFLKHHILYTKLNPHLKSQVLDRFIQNLDREKIYFLKSDIASIKRKNKRLFADLKSGKCHGLYYIYRIYFKRVRDQIKFANKLLNDNFLFTKNLRYTLDDELRAYPQNIEEARLKMKTYVQYQVANVFLFEKDLKKSVKQISYVLNNFQKQVLSWKPQLNHKEARHCKAKSQNSFKTCKPNKWFSNYLNAYSQSLDSHSSYLDNEDLEEFHISMNLKLEGIGATLSSRFGYTVVERLIPGGAAERSKKIKVKDKILAVGQKKDKLIKIFGERIEDVVSIIRGPKGTPVFLEILREREKDKNIVTIVKLVRDRVDLKEEEASISYHNIKSKGKVYKIGLLKVPSFYGSDILGKSVSRDVRKHLISAKKQKIQSLVLDLSYNRGGSLDEAVDLSGLFFAEGNVVKQTEKNKSKPYIFKDRDKRIFYNGPLVVLVNRLSASGSEIVSGTLQDYHRAIIVGGAHTFGKGSVQSVETLGSQLGALKTTVGLYFTPSGKSTQKEGVKSDIALPSIFNIDELGEKSLEYVLASQTIKNFKSPARDIFSKGRDNWEPVSNEMIKKLRLISQKRITGNEKFKKIKENLKKIREKAKNQKTITIAEVLENKDKDEKDKDVEKEENTFTKDKKKYFARPDVQEALNIAKDLAFIQKSTRSSQNTVL